MARRGGPPRHTRPLVRRHRGPSPGGATAGARAFVRACRRALSRGHSSPTPPLSGAVGGVLPISIVPSALWVCVATTIPGKSGGRCGETPQSQPSAPLTVTPPAGTEGQVVETQVPMVVQPAQGRARGETRCVGAPRPAPSPAWAEVIPPEGVPLPPPSPPPVPSPTLPRWGWSPRLDPLYEQVGRERVATAPPETDPVCPLATGAGSLDQRVQATGPADVVPPERVPPSGAVAGNHETHASRASTVMRVGECGDARCTLARTRLASAARGWPRLLQLPL